MDVNGTRFHLLKGEPDWALCRDLQDGPALDDALDWDGTCETVRLPAHLTLFRRPPGGALSAAQRRGAAADRFGNMYWIGTDGQSIRWLPRGTNRVRTLWPAAARQSLLRAGDFAAVRPETQVPLSLAGLAVTDAHYLVAGAADPPGLLVLDIEGGGAPGFVGLPVGTRFAPFDLAPAPNGGVWVLDRENRAYWGFDRDFRPVNAAVPPAAQATPGAFRPEDGTLPEVLPTPPVAAGFPLALELPLAIAAMPDGAVLVLDGAAEAAPGTSASLVQRYRDGAALEAAFPLRAALDVESPDGDAATELLLSAHAIAYDPDTETLYAADCFARQAIAFGLAFDPKPRLSATTAFLPLHLFGGRALVAWRDGTTVRVSYDVDASGNDATTRWAQLRTIDRPNFATEAIIATPIFDGRQRDCVWDSVFLDACIPPGTSVQIASCADNERDLIDHPDLPFVAEPALYLRRKPGSEIPWYTPFPPSATDPPPQGRGTWELLLQQARGRYLRLRLTISGNGRASPEITALRVWYPRFSYPRHYLPAVYQEDPTSASFVERLLANPKGFYTDIEGAMRDIGAVLDARSAPIEALDWLAGWVGLVFDPAWQQINQRRQTGSSQIDRRRLFIRFATRLFDRRGTTDGIRFALQLFLEPCLETLLGRMRRARVEPDAGLSAMLNQLGLTVPDATMTDIAVEDLLSQYLLLPRRPSKIRLVELFMSRDGRAAALGDPTGASVDPAQAAHRFVVLVPETLATDELAMVSRIVQLEKPAHTAFVTRRYWEGFLVGEARLGIDTALGDDARFVPVLLGQTALANGYLDHAPPPMNAADRMVLNRDRIGALSGL